MKRKLIALGIISPLFLAMCVVGVLLLSVTGWLVFRSEGQTPTIKKRATLGPLALFTPIVRPPAAAVPANPLVPLPAATNLPPANAPAEAAALPPTAEVKTALGFELPPNTVSSVNPAGVATRLVIPKLKLDAPVMVAPIENQTWNVSRLGQAVGHLEGTAPPGSNSNIVLAGHITLAAGVYGPFAGLAQLAAGDEVLVYEGDKGFRYIVDNYQLVERTAIEVTQPTTTGQITLITCSNWSRETNKYEQRIVVKGHLAQP